MTGYLAPYRSGVPYHLNEFNNHNIFHGPKELFNHRHSSLRNVIERSFGVLKSRFPILRNMPRFKPIRQGTIVLACCVVHNWIIMQRERDEFFDEEYVADEFGFNHEMNNVLNMSPEEINQLRAWRDELAFAMWQAHNA